MVASEEACVTIAHCEILKFSSLQVRALKLQPVLFSFARLLFSNLRPPRPATLRWDGITTKLSTMAATAAQAWAILARHARDEISHLRLQELCSDRDRVSSLVAVHNAPGDRILLIDLSRQRMDLDTLNHLLRLANARDIPKYIKRVAWGQNDPDNPVVPTRLRAKHHSPRVAHQARFFDGNGEDPPKIMPTMHLALRVPAKKGLEMLTADGNNALIGIHRDWGRMERFSDSIRRNQLKGATGASIRESYLYCTRLPWLFICLLIFLKTLVLL